MDNVVSLMKSRRNWQQYHSKQTALGKGVPFISSQVKLWTNLKLS